MLKYYFLFLNLFFAPCLYAQKINIPVHAEEEDSILGNENKNYQNAKESIDNPAQNNPNTEHIPGQIKDGTGATTKSINDIAGQIKSGHVEQFGGENGFLEIHLRGARAFAPTFYFNGLPLTSATNGQQNFNMLPSSFVDSLNVYPDAPPFWLSTQGIGGDINIISCTKNSCFDSSLQNNINQWKISTTVGSYHYGKFNLSHGLKLSPQTQSYETIEYTKSLEDYPVFNNNNSTLNAKNGNYENLSNNDFSNTGGAFHLETFFSSLGKLNFNMAFSSRNQGIPGPIGTISVARLKQNLLATTANFEKLFPQSGLQMENQIGLLYNSITLEAPIPTYSAQGSHSNSYNLQAKSIFILPTEFVLQEQTGLSLELLNSNSFVQKEINNNQNQITTETKANRIEFRTTLFEGLTHHFNENYSLSANVSGWISLGQDNHTDNRKPIYGNFFSLQSEIYYFIPYFRFTTTQRRPYLNELYGSPGGTLSNNSLVNEQSQKKEFGIQFPFGDTGLFYAKDNNLIFLQLSSPVTSQYVNLQSGSRNGYFINLNYNIFSHWKTELNYQYLNSQFTQNGTTLDVPRSPKHSLNVTTLLKDVSLGKLKNIQTNFSTYANAQYESPFYIDTINTTQMSVPMVYNGGLSFIFLSSSHKFLVSADVFNLTDEKFSTLYNASGFVLQVNSNGYLGVPPPGRRFYISLTGEF